MLGNCSAGSSLQTIRPPRTAWCGGLSRYINLVVIFIYFCIPRRMLIRHARHASRGIAKSLLLCNRSLQRLSSVEGAVATDKSFKLQGAATTPQTQTCRRMQNDETCLIHCSNMIILLLTDSSFTTRWARLRDTEIESYCDGTSRVRVSDTALCTVQSYDESESLTHYSMRKPDSCGNTGV